MQSLAPVAARFGIDISIVEPAAVASHFVANTGAEDAPPDPADPYAPALAAYLARTKTAFAAAQEPRDAARVIAVAATTAEPKFRWQTSASAIALAGLSLADLDGSRVLAQTATWIA